VLASNGDPYANCASPGQKGINYGEAEVEPYIAVNPADASNVIAVFQQDRWNNGGARGDVAAWSTDGGRTFHDSTLPFSHCARDGLAFDRASDPWVSIGVDGIAYASGTARACTGTCTARVTSAIVVSTSRDGGRTWARASTLDIQQSTDQFVDDKDAVTADPVLQGSGANGKRTAYLA